jgi:Uma2 family endonuclease
MTTMHVPVRPTFAGRAPYRFSADQFRRLRDAGIVTDADEQGVLAGHYRFSVDQYERLDGLGIFGWEDRVELLDGFVIRRPIINPPHATAVENFRDVLPLLLPPGWHARGQVPITLPTSQPIPDGSVARGSRPDYAARHPNPSDLAVVVEVSDTSLTDDRRDKAQLYAAAGVVEYWIVNLIDRQVEVYTDPQGSGDAADYATAHTYRPGDTVPFTVTGVGATPVPVADLLP